MSGPTFNSTNSSGNNFSASASWALSVTSVVANDTILLFVLNTTNANPTLTPTGVSDGQGAYSLVCVGTSPFNNNLSVWALTLANAGTHSVTVTFASAVSGAVAWSTWSNPTGSFVDASAAGFQTASNPLIQTVTTTNPNGTIVSYANSLGVAPTSQTGTPWFTGGSIGVGDTGQYQTQSGSGAISPSYTYAAPTSGELAAIALQNTLSGSVQLMGQACL